MSSGSTYGMCVPGKTLEPSFVHPFGKLATGVSPSSAQHSPRKRASVPIVTASELRPSVVTRKPLKAPQSAPTTSATMQASHMGAPWS